MRHAQKERITACGSGHFLLGAFERLNQAWLEVAPGLDAKERVRRAMASIHGVDINPFAVAIARFRLTVAGLNATGERSLVGVPAMGFHLAIGDSLLGVRGGLDQTFDFDDDDGAAGFNYDTEDLNEYFGILQPGQYHVVVGNPPYITPKDKALNALYRIAYVSAAGKYALSAPFMELLFRLAIRGGQGQGAGYVGQITSNSFMKREFGKKLIEYLFAGHDIGNPVDLTTVIDSSGAWVPGHNFDGTPTAILFGRRRRPVSDSVRAVLGKRDDAGKLDNPAKGPVWTELSEHFEEPGYDGIYVSVVDLDREMLTRHPWSLSGGGASDLKAAIGEAAATTLDAVSDSVGITSFTLEDDVYVRPRRAISRFGVTLSRPMVLGDQLRDWAYAGDDVVLFPYDDEFNGLDVECSPSLHRMMWPYRTNLSNNIMFGGRTKVQEGLKWSEFGRLTASKLRVPLSIAFAEVATHNHFVLDRGGKIFKQTAPVIKLPDGADADQHLELLGVLNSSTVCFWLKQVAQKKGGDADTAWLRTYAFNSTNVGRVPIPSKLPLDRPRIVDSLAQELDSVSPASVLAAWSAAPTVSLHEALASAEAEWRRLQARMNFEQEELDWEVYQLYDLIDTDLTYSGSAIQEIALGERAFEIDLARRVADGTDETAWFERHNSHPLTEPPASWPDDYNSLVQHRLELIESDRDIRLLEQPEFKRRWATTAWEVQRTEALKAAILDRLEDPTLWQDPQGPITRSVAELADLLRADPVLKELARALTGIAEPGLGAVIGGLVSDEAVPFLAAYRYKPAGVENYRAWQEVWALQRREDGGEKVTIPMPPKYGQSDFAKATYWKARGKLDVPKERFIAYPGVAREGDPTPVLGWAGWSHRDQALALAREIPVQQAIGADDTALEPLVAGLVELEPWLAQWYSEIEPQFGASPASVITGVIDQYLARMEKTREQVTEWEPPAPTRGRRASR